MCVYVLLEYMDECKRANIKPSKKGLYEFKKTWKD